jgi:subtilisin family serine protease
VPTGRLLVLIDRAHGTAEAAAARAVVARAGARPAGHSVAQIGLVTVRPRAGESLHRLASRLRADPRVSSVEVERRATPRLVPDDPALTQQDPSAGAPAGTPIEWWAAREGLPAAWDVSTGAGATVAIVDTGVDVSHPELAGRVKETIDLDAHDARPSTTDQQGHGTHVASLACAAAGNGIGLAGAGYGCSLLVIKSDLSDSSVAQALVTAVDRGADAINMSFGNDGSRPAAHAVVRAIDYAYRHGTPMVAAAADDPVEQQGDPANVLQPTGTGSDIGAGKGLSVTAANFSDRRASFAGRGSQISMAAYGAFDLPNGPRGIFGAFPANLTTLETGLNGPPCGCRVTYGGDSRYAYVRGTSMAAPMVAAVAALVKHLNPDLKAADVIRILKRTARRPAGTGWTPELGWGILDGGAALAAARVVDRTPPVSTLTAPAVVSGRSFVLRLSGRDPARPGLVASGIDHYEVWRSIDGGRARRIASTSQSALRVGARPGVRYAFYSLAVDRAHNREVRVRRSDARTRVARAR